MVGIAARMRESSVTLPSSSGTLKSTRTNTRFPATSASRTVSLSIAMSRRLAAVKRRFRRRTGSFAATIAMRSAQRQL